MPILQNKENPPQNIIIPQERAARDLENILVLNMSIITKDSASDYITPASDIISECIQTNEAPTKYVISYLAHQDRKLQKIICVTSKEVFKSACNVSRDVKTITQSAYDFFTERIRVYCSERSISMPDMEAVCKDETTSSTDILRAISALIKAKDTVFLDTTGGQRDDIFNLQLLFHLFSYRGIKTELVLYSNLGKRKIEDCRDSFELIKLLNGVSQFEKSGRLEILQSFFGQSSNERITNLIKAMERFSESMQLCRTDNLLYQIREIQDGIEQLNNDTSVSGQQELFFREALGMFKAKFFGDIEELDYVDIIDWCRQNGLIQQAVTVYVEKIPEILFDEKLGYIKVLPEGLEKLRKQGSNPGSSEKVNLFFTILLNVLRYKEEHALDYKVSELESMLIHLKTVELNGKFVKTNILESNEESGNPDVVLMYRTIIKFVCKCLASKESIQTVAAELQNRCGLSPQEDSLCKLVLMKGRPEKIEKLVKVLQNDKGFLKKLITGEDTPNEKSDYYSPRLYLAAEAKTMDFSPFFEIGNIDRDTLQGILFDAIYFKAIRNQINHASDTENLAESQKEILSKRGYDMDFNTGAISKVLEDAVARLRNL